MRSSWALPDPGIKLTSLTSSALAGRLFTTSATWEAQILYIYIYINIDVYIIYLETEKKEAGKIQTNKWQDLVIT